MHRLLLSCGVDEWGDWHSHLCHLSFFSKHSLLQTTPLILKVTAVKGVSVLGYETTFSSWKDNFYILPVYDSNFLFQGTFSQHLVRALEWKKQQPPPCHDITVKVLIKKQYLASRIDLLVYFFYMRVFFLYFHSDLIQLLITTSNANVSSIIDTHR